MSESEMARWPKPLSCAHCGAESPVYMNIENHPKAADGFAAAVESIGAEGRGWQEKKKATRCQACHAITVADPKRLVQRCPFCASSSMVTEDKETSPIRPHHMWEFRIAESEVHDKVRQWIRSRWFAPSRLGSRLRAGTLSGIYVPYWAFDAQVFADWQAESGYHYYETEYSTNSKGKRQANRVQHTRWAASSGWLEHFFSDELVPASQGIPEAMLRKIEPFPPQSEMRSYDPALLSGWLAEQYQIDIVAAAQHSRERMDRELDQLCAQRVSGDTHRNLRVHGDYSAQTLRHILLPVWVLAYTCGGQSYQVLVNGYTGALTGRHPVSWAKMILLAAAILLLVGAVIGFTASSAE